MKKSVLSLHSLHLLIVVLFFSCANHDPYPHYECTSTETVSFQNQVFPIVEANCIKSGCHNGDQGEDKDWRVFETFQAKSARVKDRITRPPGTQGHMPATGEISEEQIITIVCWVDQGAQDN